MTDEAVYGLDFQALMYDEESGYPSQRQAEYCAPNALWCAFFYEIKIILYRMTTIEYNI